MKLKQIPEDFIVRELASIPFTDSGEYAYFLLRKKDWNTMDAVKEIAERLALPSKKVSYAGIKDKKAVTEQFISIQGVPKEKVLGLKIKDIELEFVGYANEKMSNEMLQGNGFRITLRGLEKEIRNEPKLIPNYFDEQRFGINARNHLVGQAIVKRQFGRACDLMGIKAENNPVNTLLAKKEILFFCFNAYQSYLFNLALAEYVRKHAKNTAETDYSIGKLAFGDVSAVKNISLPLVHFDTSFENDEVKRIYEKILKDEEIKFSDFLIRQMPNLVQLSPSRMAFVAVKDYNTLSFEKDELNEGLMKQIVSFSLPKGSYATIVVKWLELQ
ncbi:MAG: tRNA pseudouridine(13) synthase TruD [Candidatus Nanoarchaeia archaeon]|nr:tRNA pseudouridine(13) synthase TruD [Candidatus Nanoarchaeia archaeon]